MSARTRPGLPTVEELLSVGTAHRLVAPREWEDLNGHVTVTAYYDFHMQAVIRAIGGLGWSEDYIARTGNSVFTVEQHLAFYDEALAGHEISGHVRLIDRNERFLHAISILVNHTTGRVANTLEIVDAHVNLTTRRTVPFTDNLARMLDDMLARHRALPWSVPLNTGMGLR